MSEIIAMKSKLQYFSNFETTVDLLTGWYKFSPPIHQQRYNFVCDTLSQPNWRTCIRKVAEFGCGNLKSLPTLAGLEHVSHLLAIDQKEKMLKNGLSRLEKIVEDIRPRLDPLRVSVLQGGINQMSEELRDVDAVVAVEVIEHLEQSDLKNVPATVFAHIQPRIAIFTTPNADFNENFSNLRTANGLRKADHKFEWTRSEFKSWCSKIIKQYPNYGVFFSGVGEGLQNNTDLGYASQIASFVRMDLLRAEPSPYYRGDTEELRNYRLISEFLIH